jgi:hypothetical protein
VYWDELYSPVIVENSVSAAGHLNSREFNQLSAMGIDDPRIRRRTKDCTHIAGNAEALKRLETSGKIS